jgi:hypothetical protein
VPESPIVVGPEAVRLRFGPGAPATVPPPIPLAPMRPRRPWTRPFVRTMLTVLIIGAVGVAWWWRSQPAVSVAVISVAPAQPPGDACDITVDVIGTVGTDGRPGIFTYQWVRSDGQASEVLRRSTELGSTTVQVHLHWTFHGEGTYEARATLRILTPTRSAATGHFTYACLPAES